LDIATYLSLNKFSAPLKQTVRQAPEGMIIETVVIFLIALIFLLGPPMITSYVIWRVLKKFKVGRFSLLRIFFLYRDMGSHHFLLHSILHDFRL
jgi:hypothetical protein